MLLHLTPLALNSQGIVSWLIQNLIPIILTVIGIIIITNSRKGKFSDSMGIVANVMVGVVLIAAAGSLYAFGDELASVIFTS